MRCLYFWFFFFFFFFFCGLVYISFVPTWTLKYILYTNQIPLLQFITPQLFYYYIAVEINKLIPISIVIIFLTLLYDMSVNTFLQDGLHLHT